MSLVQQASFPDQQADEEVLVCTHRHWLFLLPDIVITLVLVAVPILALVAANLAGAEPFEGDARAVTAVALPAWYLSVVTFFFIRWLDYYLDLAVVTNRRVVDIDQHGLFRRNVAELQFEALQDVSVNKAGILQTFFNFGDVLVQTAGERPNFVFRAIPHPDEVVQQITAVQQQQRDKEGQATEELSQAAEKMSEAADKMHDEVAEPLAETVRDSSPPDKPNDTPPPPPPRSEDPPDNDLPKEFER